MSPHRFGPPTALTLIMVLTAVLSFAAGVRAQVPPPPPPPQTPHFNPSSPLVVPQAPEVPVSPGMSGGARSSQGVSGVPAGIIAAERGHDVKKAHRHRPQRRRRHPHHDQISR
jgi:hypothetical protein